MKKIYKRPVVKSINLNTSDNILISISATRYNSLPGTLFDGTTRIGNVTEADIDEDFGWDDEEDSSWGW